MKKAAGISILGTWGWGEVGPLTEVGIQEEAAAFVMGIHEVTWKR